MKTLVKNEISLYLFDDSQTIVFFEGGVSVGSPVEFHISDCNVYNSALVNVTNAPSDWVGRKYCYKDGLWVENPHWSGDTDPFESR